jgi:methionyl aminopeptidase
MHEDPDVPNYGKPKRGLRLIENMVIAIEPMIALGGDYRVLQMDDDWTFITIDRSPAAHFEKTIAVTSEGPIILTTEDEEADLLRMNEALAEIAADMGK